MNRMTVMTQGGEGLSHAVVAVLSLSLWVVTACATDVQKESSHMLNDEVLQFDAVGHRATRAAIVIPHICDNAGHYISDDTLQSQLKKLDMGRREEEAGSRVRRSASEAGTDLTLRVQVKGKTLKIRLRKMLTSAKSARIEWVSDNVTESWFIDQPCMVTGEVQGRPQAHATFNLCNGVSGVINIGNKDIYIQPVSDAHNTSVNRPHIVTVRKSHKKWRLRDAALGQLGAMPVQQKTDSETSPFTRRRNRRSLSKEPRYMEILLVTDRSVVRFHGRSLVEQYLLTQMNLVNEVYHHSSLELEINIVVTKMIVIDDTTAEDLIVKGEGQKTLDKFCIWANEHNHRSNYANGNYDIAVYVTRRDMGPAGYAPVTGMCNPHRSCAVNKDDGISSAFVIAHEIGHTFGMVHDGKGTECEEKAAEGNIMASMVQATYHNYHWSECSSTLLIDKIQDMDCLMNKPDDPTWPTYEQPYGQSWSLDEQCRQEFGSGFTLCRVFKNMDPCHYLWCSTAEDPMLCKTKRGTPLPGSKCGFNQWCMDGKCVSTSDSIAVHGGWTTWGGWTECSRSCGAGTQYRHRMCSDPRPQHGGRACEGDIEDMRMCNKQACATMGDFRADQCAQHDDGNFFGDRRHHWTPLENKNTSKMCKLTCISQETQDVFVSDDDVIDGTFCSYELQYHVCIKGRCKPVGCDGSLGSTKKADRCGVCEGDGTSCKVISGTFQRNLTKKAYHRILMLPKFARDIEIQESDFHLAHSLALKDGTTNQFIQHGRDKNRHSRQFVLHGTRFVYLKKSDGESISARGPLLNPIYVMVYSMSNHLLPLIKYKYTVPAEMDNSMEEELYMVEQDRYQWQLLDWTECTVTCGGGVRYEVHICMDMKKDKKMTQGMCSLADKPAQHREPCNHQDCPTNSPYRWKTDEWSVCSPSCGERGVQQRLVECVSGQSNVVDPRYCYVGEMPVYNRPCNKVPCPALWKVTNWSKCSVSCGSGTQRRKVNCDKPRNGNKYKCHGDKPADTRICDMSPCPGCHGDQSVYCGVKLMARYCGIPAYNKLCCKSCENFLQDTSDTQKTGQA